MNVRVLVALARWHLGRLGGLPLLAATPLLGWLTGAAFSHASRTALGPSRLSCALAIAAAAFAIACASSPAAARASRSLLLFSAPLYGRELARALSVVPCCLAVVFALAALTAAHSALFAPLAHTTSAVATPPSAALLVAIPAVVASIATLIVLSATLRDGWRARLYQVLALGSALLLTALPSLLNRLASVGPVRANDALAFIAWLAVAATLGFLALRAFGETLARYDPLTAS